jgi:hypothetical protein
LSSTTNFAGQGVGVGRDLLAEEAEGRIAVALLEVAQDLVVGAVLADHVEDVLDGEGSPTLRGMGEFAGRPRAQPRGIGVGRDGEDGLRVGGELSGGGNGQHGQGALQHRPRVLPFLGEDAGLRPARVRHRTVRPLPLRTKMRLPSRLN